MTYAAFLDDSSPLPDWIGFDTQNLNFNGIAPPSGKFMVTVKATDSSGSTSYKFYINIKSGGPVITCENEYYYMVYQPVNIRINVMDPNGLPYTYSVTQYGGSPLPAWLSFSNTTKTFTG
jgi:hypothetical protein